MAQEEKVSFRSVDSRATITAKSGSVQRSSVVSLKRRDRTCSLSNTIRNPSVSLSSSCSSVSETRSTDEGMKNVLIDAPFLLLLLLLHRYDMGRQAAMTKLSSNKTIRKIRVRGGNYKFRALRLDTGNYAWGSESVTRKTRILDVVYNASNNELVRTQTLVKNAIIQVRQSILAIG